MQSKKVFLAVVLDEKGKPKCYIDIADIRTLLLRSD
jgi:hypothetical protein